MPHLKVRTYIALLLSVLLCLVSTSQAQRKYSYSPKYPTGFLTNNGAPASQNFVITNNTYDTLNLKVRFVGDPTLTIDPIPTSPTTLFAKASVSYTISFKAVDHRSQFARLIIEDTMGNIDSVGFSGLDTGLTFKPTWFFIPGKRTAGRHYKLPDQLSITLYNQHTSAITVTAAMLPGAYGFNALGSQQRTIQPNKPGKFDFEFNSTAFDSGFATIQFSDGKFTDTVSIWGSDADPLPFADTLHWKPLDLGAFRQGTEVCSTITLYNRSAVPAAISEMWFEYNPQEFRMEGAPPLPYSIPAQDSLTLTICATSTRYLGAYLGDYLHVRYETPGLGVKDALVLVTARVLNCIELLPNVLDLGLAPLNKTISGSTHIVNSTADPITIDSFSQWHYSPGFTLLTLPPFTIPALDSVPVTVSFKGSTWDSTRMDYFYFYSKQCEFTPSLRTVAIPYDPPIPTYVYWLFADSIQTIPFEGDGFPLTRIYSFVNNFGDSVKIVSVGLKNGLYFQVTDIYPETPEFTLPADSTLTLTVRFIGPPGTYEDTIVMVTDDALQALTFPMHAIIEETGDVVSQKILHAELQISPNPSSGPLQIVLRNVVTATVDVLDIMGVTVAGGINELWDPADLPRGTYFVRASGVAQDGKPFVLTQRVVIR